VRPKERVEISLRRVSSLTVSELDDIWAVTSRYIDTDRSLFEARLRALPQVGLWQVRDGSLVGLVNFDVYPVTWEGRVVTIIFTSSVVIDERFRGRHLVLLTGLRILLRTKLRHPLRPSFWLFDTFSYKSYLLLPRNLHIFWPRRDQPTPHRHGPFPVPSRPTALRGQLAPGNGCSKSILRINACCRRPHRSMRQRFPTPMSGFSLLANPRHRDGDRLVCLAPLSVANLTGAVGRMLRF